MYNDLILQSDDFECLKIEKISHIQSGYIPPGVLPPRFYHEVHSSIITALAESAALSTYVDLYPILKSTWPATLSRSISRGPGRMDI